MHQADVNKDVVVGEEGQPLSGFNSGSGLSGQTEGSGGQAPDTQEMLREIYLKGIGITG
ncbi:hypothetical protein ACPOL_7235 (plasmid) [Acidisarcina polymorpha]|uniref:Uncharacterized protein n=1 Tax=Acidisarcina polymorpha TaxID=2211140 RepID=A0A2Z5GCS3_9BACT|nr:hypothetical protein ACPOL_7235 [Acidisarcina polymorpha]